MRLVKILSILALGIAILAFALNYFVKAANVATISGYLILLDQKVSQDDYLFLGEREFSTIIYLPSSNGEGIVTYCIFTFPQGVNEKADILKDGVIDYADLYIATQSYGCQKDKPCWDESFRVEKCYFIYSGRKFEDPSRDCYINETDLNMVKKNFGKTTNPRDPNCDLDEVCRSDINRDGIVDIFDVAILAARFNQYANEFVNFGYIKKKDADINGDGIVDMLDVATIGINFGKSANQQKCMTTSLENLGNNKYRVSVKGRGIHYVGVSYKVLLM